MVEKALFSLQELEYANEPIHVLIKKRVLEKVDQQWQSTAEHIQSYLLQNSQKFPQDIKIRQWKLSKGDNHKGLPYCVLDYPAIFKGEDIFTFRMIFLWGHHIAYTFQCAGYYWQIYQSAIKNHFDHFKTTNYHFAISLDPWQHINNESNYRAFNSSSKEDFHHHLDDINYGKIVHFDSIENIGQSNEMMVDFIDTIISALALQTI